MSTSVPVPTPKLEKVTKVYKYFNLDTFETIKEVVEVTFSAPATLQEAMERVENNTDNILKALSSFLKRAAFKEKKLEIAKKGARSALVLNAIRVFRSMPPFDAIYELDSSGQAKKDKEGGFVVDRKEQTRQLLEVLKTNKPMVDAIRAAAIRDAELEDDDQDGVDEES